MSVSNSFFKAVNAVKSKLNFRQTQAPAPVLPQMVADPVLMQMLSEILGSEGIASSWQGSYLSLPEGLVLAAEPVEVVTLGEDKFRTCTRIHVSHASLFPQGLSEYQHAMGSTAILALTEGFRTWVKMDLLVLLDAIRESPKDCMVIETNIASEAELADGRPLFRQVILGPVAHLVSLPAPNQKEEHPFCPCCLLTEIMPAFHEVLQTSRFLGVRLFASRDNEGQLAADCRVNGEDFLPAVEHLKQYAGKWPDRGLEFRKQYVVIRISSHSVNQAASA